MSDERVNDPSNPPQASSEAPAPAEGSEAAQAAAQDPLAAAQAEVQRLRDQLLRTAADFDNFRKRARRETQDGERRAREDFLRELLPVFDNLDRAAQHAESASDVKSLSDGIGMVTKIFVDTLSRMGIERFSSLGQAFDPALHEAVQQMDSNDHPPGTVVAEVQPGYRYGERLVRPAMVVVARPKSN
ncbi:MAG TPA: nucleotide exchange factor GrpE [Polyangiaceae bacterium]|nr:nucleotide exchange factor GrpE [Polyangiaceae bacterium]